MTYKTPIRIGRNMASMELSYFEGSFPRAIGYKISICGDWASYEIHDICDNQLGQGQLQDFKFKSFAANFNGLNLSIGRDREFMCGSSSFKILILNKDMTYISATQGSRGEGGNLYGNINPLFAFFYHFAEFRDDWEAATDWKYNADKPNENEVIADKVNSVKSNGISNLKLTVFFAFITIILLIIEYIILKG